MNNQSQSSSLLLKTIDIPCIRNWKGHRLPVFTADIDTSSTLLSSGSNDRTISIWDIEKGYATHNLRGHDSIITCVRFQPDTTMVQRMASASEDGNIRIWDLVTSSLIISINEHYSAVTSIIFSSDASGYYMITGGRDKVLNIWDTRDFEGEGDKTTLASTALKATVPTNESIEGMVMFPDDSVSSKNYTSPNSREIIFATAGNRGLLRVWKLLVQGANRTSRTYGVGCIGVRTGKDIRQPLINIHDTHNNFTTKDIINQVITNATTGDDTTVPLSSQFEHLLIRHHPSSSISRTSKSTKQSTNISDITTYPYNFDLFTATRDQLLSIIQINTFKSTKNIAGFHDQFTDVKYIPRSLSNTNESASAPSPTSRLFAVATNSEQVRIVNADTFSTTLCEGHTDIVLSVAPSPDGTLVASSSKDHTIRVWDVATGICVGVCEGHTEAVGTLSFPTKSNNFIRAASSNTTKDTYIGTNGWLISGSKDRTLKLWQLSTLLSKLPSPRPNTWNPYTDIFTSLNNEKQKSNKSSSSNVPYHARTSAAVVAHEKDINAVAVAPNDKIIASASQDKTIKLWSVPDLNLIATLRGHKRGIWSVAFSPADQILASASGDNTIRLWAVSPSAGYNCIRTFEGHDSSVLSVRFIRQGMQLLSVGADGLLKLWNTNDTTECINTFDAHSDKIWALAVRPADMNTLDDAVEDTNDKDSSKNVIPNYEVQIVTAGADSILNVWRDVTSATATGEIEAAEEALLKQQNLYNAMATRDYKKAITLTLELDQPGRCGDILQELLEIGPTPPANAPDKDERFRQMMLKEIQGMQIDEEKSKPKTNKQLDTILEQSKTTRSIVNGLHPEGMSMLLNILENLTAVQMMTLLSYLREWNTQSRHGSLAQNILYLVLKYLPRGHLLAILTEIKSAENKRNRTNYSNDDIMDDDDNDEGTSSNLVTKVLPGVGTIKIPTAPTALTNEHTLTPVANTINNDEQNGILNLTLSTNTNTDTSSSSSTGIKPSTAAAAELRGLIATLLPYTQRHLDRLDRLQISTYLIDTTVYAMRGLLPNDKATLAEQELSRQKLFGEGIHKQVSTKIITATKRGYEDESSSSDDDTSNDEVDSHIGKGWLGTKIVVSSSNTKHTTITNAQNKSTTLVNSNIDAMAVELSQPNSTTNISESEKTKVINPKNQKKRAKVSSMINEVLDESNTQDTLTSTTTTIDSQNEAIETKISSPTRQSARLRTNKK